MEKLKNNIKENIAIYLVLFTTLVIFLIITIMNKTGANVEPLDTKMFNVVTSETVDKLFETNDAKMLIVGAKTCSATKNFIPHLQISLGLEHYVINYLELTDEDPESDSYKNFVSKLDVLYTLDNEEKELKEYMGLTPMIIIIKNKKVVYGSIGQEDQDFLKQLIDTYGVKYEKS